jgi:hypothetical protein
VSAEDAAAEAAALAEELAHDNVQVREERMMMMSEREVKRRGVAPRVGEG